MCKKVLDELKEAFGIKSPSVETAKDTEEAMEETTEPTVETPVEEEWIWVNGYKGMDENMQCWNNFQYEVGKTYDMPEDATIEACSSGFHMCLKLKDVFNYVDIGTGNRFFEVRALVRKSDKDLYKSGAGTWGISYKVVNGYMIPEQYTDKLAAKSIEIVRELTMDEILEPLGYDEWAEGYKKMALAIGIKATFSAMHVDKLLELGYSLPFAQWLDNNNKYEVAKAVGSQTDLSMDMKCLMIMNG